MKRIYFRPSRIGLAALAGLTALSLAFAAIVEIEPSFRSREEIAKMRAAAETAERAFATLHAKFPAGSIDRKSDPAESGLIGIWMSPVTSVYGNLQSKQTSVNPNFAAIVAQMLLRTGVRPGDKVAVGLSGSFPALNICALAACRAVGAETVTISGATASQWGANRPSWMWPDMEAALVSAGSLDKKSAAASLGGSGDSAASLDAEGKEMAREAILRNGIPLLEEADLGAAVEARMRVYSEDGQLPIAYINVGGSPASVGSPADKRLPEPGLNLEPPDPASFAKDSVIHRFSEAGVPVIHISDLHSLTKKYGLPWAPHKTPRAGEGAPFDRPDRNRPLAGALLTFLSTVAVLIRASRKADDRKTQIPPKK